MNSSFFFFSHIDNETKLSLDVSVGRRKGEEEEDEVCLEGLHQHSVKLRENEKNRKLIDWNSIK